MFLYNKLTSSLFISQIFSTFGEIRILLIMKRLLFILLIFTLFISCSSDDNEEDKYIDVNILNGVWETSFDESTKVSYEFNNGTVICSKIFNGEKTILFQDRFRLTTDKIIYYGAITPMRQSYILEDDYLFITDLIGDKSKYKYVKIK